MITVQALIDLTALQHNYQTLKKRCGDKPVTAVIKGDAYGHNAIQVAKALPNADRFAVSRIEEALELREANITQPILLLEGCFCREDIILAAQQGFETVIHNQEQLKDILALELDTPIKTWIKIDTGMHRIGFVEQEFNNIMATLQGNNNILGEVGMVSHLSCADDLHSTSTAKQIEQFLTLTAPYKGEKTLANSAAILHWDSAHFDAVRAGIALYGISPFPEKTGRDHGLKPVMTMQSKLISIRKHKAGQPVGYSERWFAERDTNIGVIAMGYGDGYPRSAPNGTPVWINGRLVPIVGTVSMDMITVDLGMDSQDKVGDSVEFWGNNLPIERIATKAGTIPYELTIKLTKRVNKTFI